jgi:hypothetical protein
MPLRLVKNALHCCDHVPDRSFDPLNLFMLDRYVWFQACAGVVGEVTPIHYAHIHGPRFSTGDHARSFVQVQRQAKRIYEIIR